MDSFKVHGLFLKIYSLSLQFPKLHLKMFSSIFSMNTFVSSLHILLIISDTVNLLKALVDSSFPTKVSSATSFWHSFRGVRERESLETLEFWLVSLELSPSSFYFCSSYLPKTFQNNQKRYPPSIGKRENMSQTADQELSLSCHRFRTN